MRAMLVGAVLGSEADGCVADASGALYVAQERAGLWRYGAEPDTGSTRTLVDATWPDGRLAAAEGCQRTDGITAYAADLGPGLPSALFVCQDNANTDPALGDQNFKLTRLEKVLP